MADVGGGIASAEAEELSVAVCQLTSVDSEEKNLEQIFSCLAALEAGVPQLICFPENALYMRIHEGTAIAGFKISNPSIQKISEWARRHGTVVHLGSVPLRRGERLYNSSLVITADGAVHDNYQKIHLFDVDVEGQKAIRESDVFAHGEDSTVFSVGGWKIGTTICYDLRFSELFLRYAKFGVDAILIPSAFLVPTGRAHWEVLVRARAIECQAYVLAAAQGGTHLGISGGSRSTHGHSLIVDPWGVVVGEVPEPFADAQRILRATLQRKVITKVRAQIPVGRHRRLDL